MAENKTKPTTVSVPEFLDACTDEARLADAKALAGLMQKVTGNFPSGAEALLILQSLRHG